MTTVNVKNNHNRTLSVGGVVIAPGATAAVPDFERVAKSHAVKVWAEKGLIEPGENSFRDDGDDNQTGYAVTDKGRGWFVVTKGGQEVTKSLREDDVKDFDGMSEEDKAAFVELHKPAE